MISQAAEWICYAASEIAKITGFTEHSRRLSALVPRIRWGVKDELLELLQLEGVGRVRARILYKHGYKRIEDIARARVIELANLPKIGLKIAERINEQAKKLITSSKGNGAGGI